MDLGSDLIREAPAIVGECERTRSASSVLRRLAFRENAPFPRDEIEDDDLAGSVRAIFRFVEIPLDALGLPERNPSSIRREDGLGHARLVRKVLRADRGR